MIVGPTSFLVVTILIISISSQETHYQLINSPISDLIKKKSENQIIRILNQMKPELSSEKQLNQCEMETERIMWVDNSLQFKVCNKQHLVEWLKDSAPTVEPAEFMDMTTSTREVVESSVTGAEDSWQISQSVLWCWRKLRQCKEDAPGVVTVGPSKFFKSL